jgi:hypothetical protein
MASRVPSHPPSSILHPPLTALVRGTRPRIKSGAGWRLPPAVEARPDGRPVRVRLGGNWLPVERFQEAWVVEGRWWATEERRQYVRAEARGAVVELVRSGQGPWSVARVLD